MNLSRSATTCNVVEFEHCWEISDFCVQQQIHNAGDSMKTEGFGSGGYEFQLQLFPNGKDEVYKEYISVYLTVLKCIGRRVKFRVAFDVETQKGPIGCALNKNVVTLNGGGLVTASKFFKISTLLEESESHLPNGCLKLKARISVYEESQTDTTDMGCIDDYYGLGENRPSLHSTNNVSLLSMANERSIFIGPQSVLLDFLESGKLADFTVHVGCKSLRLHRVILALRSNYFRAMLEPHTKESFDGEVVLKDVDPEACDHVFRYMYSNDCDPFLHVAESVMKLADRFFMDDLLLICANHLSKTMELNNFCDLGELADSLNSVQLLDKCLSYFMGHSKLIMESTDWCNLKKRAPHLVAMILEHFVSHCNTTASSKKRAKVDY